MLSQSSPARVGHHLTPLVTGTLMQNLSVAPLAGDALCTILLGYTEFPPPHHLLIRGVSTAVVVAGP